MLQRLQELDAGGLQERRSLREHRTSDGSGRDDGIVLWGGHLCYARALWPDAPADGRARVRRPCLGLLGHHKTQDQEDKGRGRGDLGRATTSAVKRRRVMYLASMSCYGLSMQSRRISGLTTLTLSVSLALSCANDDRPAPIECDEVQEIGEACDEHANCASGHCRDGYCTGSCDAPETCVEGEFMVCAEDEGDPTPACTFRCNSSYACPAMAVPIECVPIFGDEGMCVAKRSCE